MLVQYGAAILMSDSIYSLLSCGTRSLCRLVDRVTVKGMCAYVSIRQHTAAYVSMRRAYVYTRSLLQSGRSGHSQRYCRTHSRYVSLSLSLSLYIYIYIYIAMSSPVFAKKIVAASLTCSAVVNRASLCSPSFSVSCQAF